MDLELVWWSLLSKVNELFLTVDVSSYAACGKAVSFYLQLSKERVGCPYLVF